jgi:hypothetical protein
MSKNTLFPGTDLGLSPDSVIDPEDNNLLSEYLHWQRDGFAGIDYHIALRLRQWVLSSACPLAQDCKDYYLHCFEWEARNRERMTMINQFFRLPSRRWGIRIAIRKNPHTQLVHLGESEFAKNVGSKPRKLLRPSDGAPIWTTILLPQAAYRGCLYGRLDYVRRRGGVGYLLYGEEQQSLDLRT